MKSEKTEGDVTSMLTILNLKIKYFSSTKELIYEFFEIIGRYRAVRSFVQ